MKIDFCCFSVASATLLPPLMCRYWSPGLLSHHVKMLLPMMIMMMMMMMSLNHDQDQERDHELDDKDEHDGLLAHRL